MEATATNLLADPGVHGIVLSLRNVTERNATFRALQESRGGGSRRCSTSPAPRSS